MKFRIKYAYDSGQADRLARCMATAYYRWSPLSIRSVWETSFEKARERIVEYLFAYVARQKKYQVRKQKQKQNPPPPMEIVEIYEKS